MPSHFFEQPILNSPYAYPGRHWELDPDGQPTDKITESRRRSAFITPVPKPKKRRQVGEDKQSELLFRDKEGLSTAQQQYDPNTIINEIRGYVDQWRKLPNPDQWQVTPETARLLQHWRQYPFASIRPFFCQIEAVETAIWLTEVAPQQGERGRKFLDYLKSANEHANPELFRIALKLATGAGKTTVIAMLIAWQTLNAVRRPGSKTFTRGFLICTPGITIRDRLRVVLPSDPDNYYKYRELVPPDLLTEIARAKIVITNYHAFKLRERLEVSKVGRSLLKGRGPDLQTTETEGQMLQRVMPDLMGLKSVLVINDEAHHCYRHKVVPPGLEEDEDVEAEEQEEAEKNSEAARLWISGIEAVKRKLDVRTVFDLSATPFFLRGSGYAEGTLFPWTVCDFSLMDAIECGIVKLPRVPVSDNVPGADMPIYRELWKHIGKKMPKKGRGKSGVLDPLNLPVELQTALDAPYGHYQKTYALWQQAKIGVPPVFIVVCNNTSTSKLVYDYVSGFTRLGEDGKTPVHHAGRLELFRNYDENGNRLARPRTLLIDSEQLESGEALDKDFRDMASDEVERFRREMIERGDVEKARKITDQDLLREVMNTVGKEGKLGEPIRCVVSVSMLTEGWDANTVTHILGVRAFGTQLLCEQVVGRGLRRQSYDLDQNGLLSVEYADILGIPFDFTAKPVVAPPKPPRPTVHVFAVRPERDALEIRFPRVEGYRIELPPDGLVGKIHRRLHAPPHTQARRPVHRPQRRHHWRRRHAHRRAPEGHAPGHHSLPPRRATCSLPNTATPARNPSFTSSASSNASSANGWTAAISDAPALPTPPRSSTAKLPTWPANASKPPSPKRSRARTRSKPSSTPTTPRAPPGTSTLPPPSAPSGKPTRASATSTGLSATATGKPNSAASPKPIPASAPTPRTRASTSRFHT